MQTGTIPFGLGLAYPTPLTLKRNRTFTCLHDSSCRYPLYVHRIGIFIFVPNFEVLIADEALLDADFGATNRESARRAAMFSPKLILCTFYHGRSIAHLSFP